MRDIPDSETARLAELVAPRAFNFINPAIHAIAVLQAARRRGMVIRSRLPEMGFLSGEIAWIDFSSDHLGRQLSLPPATRHPWLREKIRPRHWNGWSGLPMNLLSPQWTAIGQNDMMVDWIRHNGARVDSIDAPMLLRRAIEHDGRRRADDARIAQVVTVMVASAPIPDKLDADLDERLRQYLENNIRELCRWTDEAMRALAEVRRLPAKAVNGSAGTIAVGLLASEILRRNGQVKGFDHTSGRGLERNEEFTALLEMPFSSEFVVATDEAAERLKRLRPARLLHSRHHCRLEGGRGYPTIQALDLVSRTKRPEGAPPRVTYASPIFRGWRQANPPTTADPVQLDWELRLVEQLKALPISLTCRPHPEGFFQGKVHPIARLAQTSDRLFEALLPDTDVFLFDWFRTSALWAALCTDRPIIMIELGYSYRDAFFTDDIRDSIGKRIRFVRANEDDRNRLQVDAEEIADAILSAPRSVDASLFRRVLIGEGD
ncbi:MAG: hypothetical protein ACTSX7_12620 [Alphaproteobacteria bacterium]